MIMILMEICAISNNNKEYDENDENIHLLI